MEEEMKWISIWILANIVMTALSLVYLYLDHELQMYGMWAVGLCLLTTILPYILWKYNQMKFVEKNNINIQILKD